MNIKEIDEQIESIEKQLAELDERRAELLARLARLKEDKARAVQSQISTNDFPDAAVRHSSPSEEKIALFRSLFRGREDVYPRRWENPKTGKSGY
ncbi:MAG: hypothetical protein AB1546_09175 [bacterium]